MTPHQSFARTSQMPASPPGEAFKALSLRRGWHGAAVTGVVKTLPHISLNSFPSGEAFTPTKGGVP